MKSSTTPLLVSLVILATASIQASESRAPAVPVVPDTDTNAAEDAPESIVGHISTVDPSRHSLEIRNTRSGESKTIRIDENTLIVVDGESGGLKDLKPGHLAVATMRKSDGRIVASSITAQSPERRTSSVSSATERSSGERPNVDD